MKMRDLTIITVLLIMMEATVQAATLPSYYPKNFRFVGTLDRIDPGRNTIVIGDISLILPGNVKVHTLHTEFGTINNLHPGIKVGAKLVRGQRGVPMVSEIWVLPEDYQPHFPRRR